MYYTKNPSKRVELVKRVGIGARETNNIIERLHETLKERTRSMRGSKSIDTAKNILDGYVVNYNYVRPHMSLKGNTPAQEAGLSVNNGWSELIERAIQKDAKDEARAIDAAKTVPNFEVIEVRSKKG